MITTALALIGCYWLPTALLVRRAWVRVVALAYPFSTFVVVLGCVLAGAGHPAHA